MTSGSRIRALLAKETRALLPIFAACLVIGPPSHAAR